MSDPLRHDSGKPKQFIELTSPAMRRIAGFVLANSLCRTCKLVPLRRKSRTKPIKAPVCLCEKPERIPVVQENCAEGKELILCGSGPSLHAALGLIREKPEADVWGCNDALMWLTRNGHRVTHGVGIDQTEALYEKAWTPDPPNLPYLLATSVCWRLVQHLEDHGLRHRITFWHSFCGFEGELELYGLLYPKTTIVGSGLNVVNRSIGLALYMGYETIYLAGADCALGRGDVFHVQGDKEDPKSLILQGNIGGRMWRTKPDMMMSAVDLVEQKRRLGDRLHFVGESLPRALQHKDDAFLRRCIHWIPASEIPKSLTLAGKST